MTIPFRLTTQSGSRMADVTIHQAILAGWTGRDSAAVQMHVDEMAAVGVPRLPLVPVFYRCSATRLTTAEEIQVVGEDSSGEVEFVLIQTQGALWVRPGRIRQTAKWSRTASRSRNKCGTNRWLPSCGCILKSTRIGSYLAYRWITYDTIRPRSRGPQGDARSGL